MKHLTSTRRRHYFDEPIVRTKVNRVRFPRKCPVCGNPASKTSRISTNPGRKVWLRPSFNPYFDPLSKNHLTNAESKIFLVDVCEDHLVSDNAELRMRSLSSIIASLVAGISIFALIYAGADYWAGRPVSPWVYSYLLILVLSLSFAYISFKPSALEASFRIIGFDFDLQYVWFALSNPEYRDLFLKENSHNAELVTWIVKM